MASNLLVPPTTAMASNLYIYTIDGLQPKRDDLQPNAMLQQTVYTVNALAMASNLAAMSSNLLGPATY